VIKQNGATGCWTEASEESSAYLEDQFLWTGRAGIFALSSPVASQGLQGERMPKVSFATDIKPLFRPVDIAHMRPHGIKLDDYTYMSNPDNAASVLATVSPQNGEPPSMPPGGPYWTADQLALFAQWQKDGYNP
jgi:hypothetical protein